MDSLAGHRAQPDTLLFGVLSGFGAIPRGRSEVRRLEALDAVALDAASAERQQEANAASARHKELLRTRRPYFSFALMICFGIALAAQSVAGFSAFAAAGLANDQARAGEWWRLVTGLLLHANQIHIWLDATALLMFGSLAEAYGSRLRVLLVFLLSGVAGSAAVS